MGALDLAGYGLQERRRRGGARRCRRTSPPVHGDADQLHQVVVNLVVNAQQALLGRPAPRRLAVRAWAEATEAVLEVADNGPGMAADVASRVFEPFFTTKPQGVGTGVGLSVCHGIVAAHGGRIELDTARGRGARFRVHLPWSHGGRGGARRAGGACRRGGGRVLVVDDEPEIAALLEERLAADGLTVATASSGRRALAALESGGGRRGGQRPADAGHGRRGAGEGDPPALAGPRADGIVLITGDALGADPAGRLGAARPADLREAARPRRALGRAAPAHRRGEGARR